MRAAELVTLAAAHGIDLTHVAGNASDTHGVARKRRLTAKEVKARKDEGRGTRVEETASGSGSQVYRRPAWTAAELGQAAHLVPRMPWLAACYSLAGDLSAYKELHRGLTYEAIEMAGKEDWPWRVKKSHGAMDFYIEPLTALVLDFEAHKSFFEAAPALYAHYMGVDMEVWDGALAARYARLHNKFERWYAVALGMIQRKIVSFQPEAVAS
jgi:hypothetical protein